MPHTDDHTDWEQIIRDMIARSSESAPTEPGVYRMPCGNCYVDFFRTSDGTESWLVPGDERSYTRDTVAIDRHGDHPWERMYTLGHAAAEIRRRATADDTPVEVLVEQRRRSPRWRTRPRRRRSPASPGNVPPTARTSRSPMSLGSSGSISTSSSDTCRRLLAR